MKVKVQVIIEDEGEVAPIVEEVVCLCRGDLRPETLGLTLAEGKQLLAQIQEKWYLWHGNVFQALQVLEHIEMELETVDDSTATRDKLVKLTKAVSEFHGYSEGNRPLIPNYAERYRSGETISPAFVESTVNEVVSKRMVKKQQMRWAKPGAHRLLQVRTQTLNDDLKDTFRRWYPAMPHPEIPIQLAV